jgi:hypothetical protein
MNASIGPGTDDERIESVLDRGIVHDRDLLSLSR